MKFAHMIKGVAEEVVDERMRHTLLRYKLFKKDVKRIALHLGKTGRREKEEVCDGDCSVCLEPLGREVDVITTSCGHRFHPICVAEALIAGRDHSCPLCRTPLELALPEGVDGDILRFLAQLRMAAHEMTKCHAQVLSEISAHCARLPSASAPIEAGCAPHFLAAYQRRGKEHKRKVAVQNVQRRVGESALWALTNLQVIPQLSTLNPEYSS
jgi:hypothetical protein